MWNVTIIFNPKDFVEAAKYNEIFLLFPPFKASLFLFSLIHARFSVLAGFERVHARF